MFTADPRFEALGAGGGAEAIAAGEKPRPDLRMPRTDGVTAIEAGATGYRLEDSPREELFRAVEAAARAGGALPAVATRRRRCSSARQP